MDYPEFIEAMGKINFYYKTHRSSWDTGKGPILVGQLTSKFQHVRLTLLPLRMSYDDMLLVQLEISCTTDSKKLQT